MLISYALSSSKLVVAEIGPIMIMFTCPIETAFRNFRPTPVCRGHCFLKRRGGEAKYCDIQTPSRWLNVSLPRLGDQLGRGNGHRRTRYEGNDWTGLLR